MSVVTASSLLYVSPDHQAVFRELGLDAETVFEHPDIQPWRTLVERENCTLRARLNDGNDVFWHIKRYQPAEGTTPAEQEAAGIRLLKDASIPTVEMVGYGKLPDGRSFLILDDLRGYVAGDKWLAKENSIEEFVEPVALLAAKLHKANLHHRDLYFCHFMLSRESHDVRLIDAGRVQQLPGGLRRVRWIVKDLAQLWHSLPRESLRQKIIDRYIQQMGWSGWRGKLLHVWMRSKSRAIARHDVRLRKKQPNRNISIPE
ncbi:MAG TPA: lipopolysaccharide kinase InaA family protein [Tepidisphaeraceae bacterium]